MAELIKKPATRLCIPHRASIQRVKRKSSGFESGIPKVQCETLFRRTGWASCTNWKTGELTISWLPVPMGWPVSRMRSGQFFQIHVYNSALSTWSVTQQYLYHIKILRPYAQIWKQYIRQLQILLVAMHWKPSVRNRILGTRGFIVPGHSAGKTSTNFSTILRKSEKLFTRLTSLNPWISSFGELLKIDRHFRMMMLYSRLCTWQSETHRLNGRCLSAIGEWLWTSSPYILGTALSSIENAIYTKYFTGPVQNYWCVRKLCTGST